jgi:copper homeostasis protein (lipoprotein)
MRKSYYFVALLAMATACFSCGGAQTETATNEAPAADSIAAPATDTTVAPITSSSPQQAVVEELAAIYNGLLPCKDCDGIQTLLTLNADEQQTFTLSEEYKGKKPKTVDTNGTWSVMGNIITLNSKNGMFKYQVNPEGLVGLKPDGSAMDASKYLLKKVQGE